MDRPHQSGHKHSAGHNHDDVSALRKLSRKRLWQVFAIASSFMIVELVLGLITKSLAVLADAGHMLGDVAGISIALIASNFAAKAVTSQKTYGYYRAEILASTFNTLCMLGMCGFILVEAYRRFFERTEVQGAPLIAIGIIGVIANFVSVKLLGADAKESLNTKAAYLEVLSDMIASAGVVTAGLVIQTTGWVLADTLVSLLIALALIPRTWALLMECVHVLMEGTPDHVAINALQESILALPGVLSIHDLHVWTITSGMDAMSGHVQISQEANIQAVLDQIAENCSHNFNINHTTVQVEIVPCEQKCD